MNRLLLMRCLLVTVLAGCGSSQNRTDGPADTARDTAAEDSDGAFEAGPQDALRDAVAADGTADAAGDGTTGFTSWTKCGTSACFCTAAAACGPVTLKTYWALGSDSWRVCATGPEGCTIVTATEVEGGGSVRRCVVPPGGVPCGANGDVALDDSWCTTLLTCGGLVSCPPGVLDPSIVDCR